MANLPIEFLSAPAAEKLLSLLMEETLEIAYSVDVDDKNNRAQYKTFQLKQMIDEMLWTFLALHGRTEGIEQVCKEYENEWGTIAGGTIERIEIPA